MNKKYIIFLCISFFTLLLFSVSTSPLYNNFYMDDSAIFISTAQSVLKGNVLYKDIFDHKGPILFAIQIIGQVISNGRLGIFIIQVISMFVFLFFMDKTLNLIGKKSKGLISILFGLAFFVYTMEEGNTSEELSLSMISIGYYLFFKSINKNDWDGNIPIFYTIIYGILFILITMIKLTNAIGIIGIILCVIILLLRNKKYIEILRHAFYFIFGVMIIFIPICYYFYKNNSLDEMIYATFTHNFLYIKNATIDSMSISKILLCIPVIISMFGIFAYRIKNKNVSFTFIVVNILSIILLCIGRGLQHYFIILVPNIIIGIYMMFEITEIQLTKFEKFIVKFCCVIIFVALLYHRIWYNYLVITNIDVLKYDELNIILDNITDKDNTVMICCPAEIYMYTNIIPSYKYSFTQDNSIMSSKEIEDEIIKDIENKKIRNIVVGKDFLETETMKNVKEVLEKNYDEKYVYKQKIINLKDNLWVLDFLNLGVYESK